MLTIHYYKSPPANVGKNSFATVEEAHNYLEMNGFHLDQNICAYVKKENGLYREAVIKEA